MGSHGAPVCAAHPAVAEGGLAREPLQLLEVPPRKRLPVGPEQDPCGSRPAPEGAGAGAEQGHSAGGGSWCRHCHTRLAELKRQAWKLVSGSGTPLRDPCLSSLLLDQLPASGPAPSCRPEGERRCEVCAAHLHRLTREALRLLQAPAGREDPDARPGGPGAPESPRDVPVELGPAGRQPGQVAPDGRKVLAWPSGPSVQVSVAPAGLGGVLSTVTIQAQQCLEGVWSVSRVGGLLPASCLAEAAVAAVAVADTVRDGPPALGPDGVSKMWGRGGACTAALVSPAPGSSAGGSPGPSAAASFFIRAVQKLSLASKRKKPPPPPAPAGRGTSTYPTDFSGALQLWPPPGPPCLLRAASKAKDNPGGVAKVKVMLRVWPAQGAPRSAESSPSFLKVDPRKKQVTLYDPATGPPGSAGSRLAAAAAVPRTFAFDAVFPPDSEQAEVCSGTVADVLQSVVSGADGCIFSFGPTSLGKSHTMIGKDGSPQSLGVVPCAISWLFRLIGQLRDRTGARFSVRVSAVEACGRDQPLRDLLAEVAAAGLQDARSPGVYLREDPVCGTQAQSELRAPTAERAALYLDAALAARSAGRAGCPEDARGGSHMLFTLHVYQYRVEKCGKGGMSGGRSRLHLLDLGGCEGAPGGPPGLSLPALGSVILALLSGAKHVPHRDHGLTLLLREALAGAACHATMIAHVSDAPARHAETLSTLQLAARVHRLCRKKAKCASSSSGGDSSCEEGRARPAAALPPFHPRSGARLAPRAPRDPDYSSSSEQSCDTVVYVGPGGAALSDRELTDGEGPPESVPIVPALSRRRPSGGPRDADHFRCSTFAELQERLDCIDGSEGPPGAPAGPARGGRRPSPPEATAPRVATDAPLAVGTFHGGPGPDAHRGAPEPDSGTGPELLGPNKAPGGGGRRPLPSPAPPPPGQLDGGRAPAEPGGGGDDGVVRTPLAGTSGQGGRPRVSARGRLERGLLTTTVTLQQPVELNGEDELVFTVVEELALGARPASLGSLGSLGSDCSLRALASGSRPVSIISSINDEFDAYTCPAAGPSPGPGLHEVGVCSADGLGPTPQPCPRASPDPCHPGSPAGPSPPGPPILDSSPGHDPPGSPGPEAAAATARVDREPPAPAPRGAAPVQTIHSSLPRKPRTTPAAGGSGGPRLALSPPGPGGQFEDPWLLRADGRGPLQVPSGSRTASPAPMLACARRVVDGCEVAARAAHRPEAVAQIPPLRRGATTLGVTTLAAPCGDVPAEPGACVGSPKAAPSGKRGVVPRGALFLRPGGSAPPAPPVRKSSLEHKASPAVPAPPPAGGPAWPGAAALFPGEEEARPSGRADHSVSKATSSLKARAGKAEAACRPATQGSLERCEGPAHGRGRARDAAAGRPVRAVPRLGVPPSSPAPGPAPACRGSPARAVGAPKPPAGGGKGRSLAGGGSRAPGASAKPPAPVAGRTPGGPAAGPRAAPRASPGVGAKVSRGTIMGTKQALRAAHSRVHELAAGGAPGRGGPSWGSADSDSGNDSGVTAGAPLPSPYSKVTAPRRPQRCSSGHGSDNSSVLSGELPPAMGRTALFYHSGGSSGYESLMRDSEATGSTSSAPDSMSDSGAASPGSRARSLKSPKRRAAGLQRRRLIPAPLPDAAALGRKPGLPGQWVDLPPPPGASLKEPFEIKVYEIDDVQRLQRLRLPPRGELEPPQDVEKGLVCASVKVRLAERRQQKLRDVWAKRELLCAELAATQGRLMLEPGRWAAQFEVDPALEPESAEYLAALEQATAALEQHVNLCKAHVMMVTCFDISAATPAAAPGPQEVDV
ncbi:kinesin family member 26A [Phyllostomus discolor]|uniref:Kinesin family member 26A n=1 Tax=Phyllostomus discolor TaxID=89673 RepID=A0A834BH13_9CHIR|nr:kinesin family member 26A [Phyllostomus discolor]